MPKFVNGLYDLLLSESALAVLQPLLTNGSAFIEALAPDERRRRIAEELARVIPELLESAADDGADEPHHAHETAELRIVLRLLGTLREAGADPESLPNWASPLRTLRAVHTGLPRPPIPETGVRNAWLFTTGRADPSLLAELRAELASADRVDILVSFITWSGVRKLWDVLETATAVGGSGEPRTRLRVITTTYTGATEARAVEALASLPGVDLRISLDGRRTRLHAKAWMFHRHSGFGTAYVGSANLSGSALIGGLEWTVKFSQIRQPELFMAGDAHFETLWNDSEFQPFDPRNEEHRRTLREALRQQCSDAVSPVPTWFDIQPKAFQKDMLDRIATERRHGRFRNLVVSATGTGKTVVAALDYRRISQDQGAPPKLLFVTHRTQILQQALATYRQVLRRSDFGEILAGGNAPSSPDHLFATIQSLDARQLVQNLGPAYWHTVVIDECHHLPADSFDRFARTIEPKYLLGLTATPERSDGESILAYFDARADGSPAVVLRLWDALDQQLVAPFEYYATADDTDLRSVRWGRREELVQLDNVLSASDVRARTVIDAIDRYVGDRASMKALAFCVSVRHAGFMARRLSDSGIPSVALSGESSTLERAEAPRRLADGKIQVICTCDLYNEGIDLPDVNTLFLLRPTQSPLLFQQQIGRGLRLAKGKEVCLILDFVGLYDTTFSFDRLYASVTGLSRVRLTREVQNGFSSLPPGCHIQLDRVAKSRVLESLRQANRQTWNRLRSELAGYVALMGTGNVSLTGFLAEQSVDLYDIYRNGRYWSALRRESGLPCAPPGPDEDRFGRGLANILHADDPSYLAVWKDAACGESSRQVRFEQRDDRRLQMLAYQVFGHRQDLMDEQEFLRRLGAHAALRAELGELAKLLADRSDVEPRPVPGLPEHWPLTLHAHYEIREILTAIGWLRADRRAPFRAGVLAMDQEKTELLFVTLDKREGFHERIAFNDYAISPNLFHWQTQNSAGPGKGAGRRYLESPVNGWRFQLFVRENREKPYCTLGPVELEEAHGSHPMSIVWKVVVPLPSELFRRYSVLRAA